MDVYKYMGIGADVNQTRLKQSMARSFYLPLKEPYFFLKFMKNQFPSFTASGQGEGDSMGDIQLELNK